jgi:hypothetical protein
MNISEVSALSGKAFCLWLTDEKDESAVFGGRLQWNGTQLQVERNNGVPFEIREEWIERIRPVENDVVRNILLGADYYLRLAVGPKPEGEGFVTTGLRWPD